jgi:hypothetical protein
LVEYRIELKIQRVCHFSLHLAFLLKSPDRLQVFQGTLSTNRRDFGHFLSFLDQHMRSVTDLFQMLEADTQLRVVLNRRYVFSDCRSLAPRNKEGVFTGIPHSAVEQILRYFHALGVVVAKRKDQSGLKLSKHVCHLQLAAIKQYKQHQSITFISLNPII